MKMQTANDTMNNENENPVKRGRKDVGLVWIYVFMHPVAIRN